MKTIIALFLVASATVASWSSAATIELDVNGLVCAFCAQGIEKTLKKFPATDGVFVSLENRVVAVQLKAGGTIEDEALRSAITNSGYTVVAIRRTDETLDALRTRVAAAKGGKGHD